MDHGLATEMPPLPCVKNYALFSRFPGMGFLQHTDFPEGLLEPPGSVETAPTNPSRCEDQGHKDREARQMSPQSAKSYGGQNDLSTEQPHETGDILGI